MNKNTLIGLFLIGLILLGFSWYNNEQYEKQAALIAQQQPATTVEPINEATGPKKEIAKTVADTSTLLYKASLLNEEFSTLQNNKIKLTLSSKGAKLAQAQLKNYKSLDPERKGDTLELFLENSNRFALEFYTPELVSTEFLGFNKTAQTDSTITYRLYADSTSYLEYIYTLQNDSYMVDLKINLDNFKNTIVTNQSDMELSWNVYTLQQEKSFKNENKYTTVAYKFPREENIETLTPSEDSDNEEINTNVQWVAFKQQFFSSVLIAKNNFATANVGFATFEHPNTKKFTAELSLPYSAETKEYELSFYLGPNKYSELTTFDNLNLSDLITQNWWGIVGWVNKWIVIPIFDFLGHYIASYGIIILLLTIFIKLIIAPLTYKSYLSGAKMRILKPEIDKIAEKFPKKEDAMKKQQATMAFYKQANVSPFGGCLPMLIQFPFLIAMFQFFPTSIELRGEPFLWADDLSSYDSILNFGFSIPFYGNHISLFTLLMAVSLFFTTKMNSAQQPNSQMPGMKFMMLYMMPIMLLCFFNDSSSGLSYYYLLSNIITIGQTLAFRYAINDEKLHARLKANSAKNANAAPKKKSKWAHKLEEMQKVAAERQKQQQQNKR